MTEVDMGIERVGVIGGGQMGAGIAEVCAKAGVEVIVHEITDELASRARARIEKSLDRAVDKGKLDAGGRDEALGRLTTRCLQRNYDVPEQSPSEVGMIPFQE